MKIWTTSFLTAVVFTVGSAGCGDDLTDDELIDDSMQQLKDAGSDFYENLCRCLDQQGGEYYQCLDALADSINSLNSSVVKGCERRVAQCYTREYTQYIDCQRDAFDYITGQLAQCPSNTDQAFETTDAKMQYCKDARPNYLVRGLQQCTSGENFTCPK